MSRPVYITKREKIAEAMNFGKYPVLSMEVGKPCPGWDDYTAYEGCKVKILFSRSKDIYNVCTLSMYGDEQEESVRTMPWKWDKIHLSNGPTCLDSSFGYTDVQEMLQNANLAWVKPGQEVIVVFNDSVHKVCWVRKMVVSDRVNDFCQTVTTIVNPPDC